MANKNKDGFGKLLNNLEKIIVSQVEAEMQAKKLINENNYDYVAQLIRENERLKNIDKDWKRTMRYTMKCKRFIASRGLTQKFEDEINK